MNTKVPMQLRAFPVMIRDNREGSETLEPDTIVLTKAMLQAAQSIGETSTELIKRIYNRAGYTVEEVGKPERREVYVDLEELFKNG